MRFVSRSVVTGFVNALAILIFMAQLPELIGVTWHVYAMTAAGLAIIYGLPLLTRAVPSPLVTIVVLSAVAITLDLDIRTRRRHGRAAGQPAGVPAPGCAR
jgi:SulP family sulfate permease